MVEGHEDAIMTLTAAADVAAIVARAIEYEGQWPEVGGIIGSRMSFSQIIELGEKVRGILLSPNHLRRISSLSDLTKPQAVHLPSTRSTPRI